MDTRGLLKVFNKVLLGLSIATGIALCAYVGLMFLALLTMDQF